MRDQIDDAEDRLEVDELIVRSVMAIGVLVWSAAAVMSLIGGEPQIFYGYAALTLMVAAVAVVGWFYERAAGAILFAGAAAVVLWGLAAGWELGLWVIMSAFLIAPAIVAAGLFMFADHEEKVVEGGGHAVPARPIHA